MVIGKELLPNRISQACFLGELDVAATSKEQLFPWRTLSGTTQGFLIVYQGLNGRL